jgi:hypothetical protein
MTAPKMTAPKSATNPAARFTAAEFAALGTGQMAYVREMRSEEVARAFPDAPEIPAGLQLYALLAADGSPIVITDDRNTVTANAWELDLTPVSLH